MKQSYREESEGEHLVQKNLTVCQNIHQNNAVKHVKTIIASKGWFNFEGGKSVDELKEIPHKLKMCP